MNDFYWDNSDILFCMKKDNIHTYEAPHESIDWDQMLSHLKYRLKDGNLDLSDYEPWIFDGKCQKILDTPFSRLKYIYASMHNDSSIDAMVKEIFPEVTGTIIVPANRCTNKYYLQHWMEEYGFSLKDFWLNDKYIVCCDNPNHHFMDDLVDNGLIDWEAVEYCSEYAEREDD